MITAVYSASRNLYPYMLPSIKSLLDHNEVETIYLMIEDDELPYEVPKECKCINVRGQQIFPPSGVNYRSVFTYMALMRAAYTVVLPKKLDKVLQLDIDTIVTDDLTELWNTDIKGKWFAACNEDRGRHRPFGGDKYYNIGVALFNLKQIRKDHIDGQIVQALNTIQMDFLEQDAWNMYGLANDKIVELPCRYNACFATGETDNPAIVHFAGFPDWMRRRSLPGREYLDKYRHLFRE